MIRKVEITPDMVERAKINAGNLGELKRSVTKGARTTIGMLGEELVKKYFNIPKDESYHWDSVYNGKTLECKTKTCNKTPQHYFNASIFDINTTQQCDYYVFCFVSEDYKNGWIGGCIKPVDYYHQAIFRKGGESDGPKFKFTWDCYNLPVSKLLDIDILSSKVNQTLF